MKDYAKNRRQKIYTVFVITKYLFCLLLILACLFIRKDSITFAISILELLIIIIVSNEMLKKSTKFLIIHDLIVLLFNIQSAVMLFSGNRLSMILISNIDMAFDLAGLSVLYIGTTALILVVSLLPIPPFTKAGLVPGYRGLSALLAIELLLTLSVGSEYSPMYGYVQLVSEIDDNYKLHNDLIANEDDYALFYRKDIWNAREIDHTLTNQPNVILIFAEGLSRHILLDSREIMPNIAAFEKECIHFEDYYNHTFATYRALNGQLYSGYQLDNYDSNSLISLQSILEDQGYHTCLINTEPHNYSFTKYLQNMEFQEFISDSSQTYDGMVNTLSDTEAFELLFDTVDRLGSEDTPFFTVMYTMGTHMSFNSEEFYGNGQNPELNKFWNLDKQFSNFMNRFSDSSLSDNTIIIFTSDHATYADEPYMTTFSAYYQRNHSLLDEIPLLIYYKEVAPETIKVKGRNSLDLAPTICDLLDISVPNYFLGISLFYPYAEENGIFYDTIFYDSNSIISTKNELLTEPSIPEKEYFLKTVKQYFAISRE